MTIEIRQLVIRAVVSAEAPPGPVVAASPPPQRQAAERRSPAESPFDPEALAAQCVREVLRKLERSRER